MQVLAVLMMLWYGYNFVVKRRFYRKTESLWVVWVEAGGTEEPQVWAWPEPDLSGRVDRVAWNDELFRKRTGAIDV